jgi:hypothetical protein
MRLIGVLLLPGALLLYAAVIGMTALVFLPHVRRRASALAARHTGAAPRP